LFGFIRFSNEHTAFIIMLVMVLAVYALLRALMSSPYGVLVRSIREDEVRVKFLGYSTDFYKWLTFVLSSVLAGLAGCMFALIQGFVSPDVMSPFHNVNVIFAALIGGAGCLYGALIGAVVFLLIKNFLPLWAAEAGKVLPFKIPQWEMWLGIVLLIIVFAWRQGLVGVVRHRLAGRLGPRGRPGEEEA
jgi:branched-chain amino acid transport system permease protein